VGRNAQRQPGQFKPHIIIFAGQNIENGGTYNQDQNYIWLADTSQNPVNPVPLETGAPHSGNFELQWQGRAPWWSPDEQWVAYRASPPSPEHKNGLYAIFVYQYGGSALAVQLTDPEGNMNHAKWYPNGFPGGPSGNQNRCILPARSIGKANLALRNLDVSPIVG
jgi:hypothetical protein